MNETNETEKNESKNDAQVRIGSGWTKQIMNTKHRSTEESMHILDDSLVFFDVLIRYALAETASEPGICFEERLLAYIRNLMATFYDDPFYEKWLEGSASEQKQ